MTSILRRRRLSSTSPRIDAPLSECPIFPFRSHTMEHLVKTYGRLGRPLRASPTTLSERPSPYTAAVSIQLMPRSSASWIAPRESLSFCGPHPNVQPPPPIAHAPMPIGVIFISLLPSLRVSISVFHHPRVCIAVSGGFG